jgi:hypothetical protein
VLTNPNFTMSGWGWFFLLLLLFLIFGAVGWVLFTRRRASRQGLPPPTLKSYIPFLGASSSANNFPSPRQGGVIGWFKDQIASFKNKRSRTAQGAYEEPLEGGGGGRRGRMGADEEAWDARMGGAGGEYDGPGGYYEEQELGLQPSHGNEPYGGTGYGQGGRGDTAFGANVERGRSRSRDPEPYLGAGGAPSAPGGSNPFGDAAERSDLRDVSPRPVDPAKSGSGQLGHQSKGSHEESPTERRSMFHESL